MTLKLKKWDVVEHMNNEEFISEYLKESFESGDTREIIDTLNDVVRARNITELASKVGLTYQELYKTLSEDENLDFTTIQKLLDVLEVKINIKHNKQIEQNIPASM